MSDGRRPVEARGWEHSQLGRLVTMFHAPQRTFAVLARSPTIAAVLVATTFMVALPAGVAMSRIDPEESDRRSIEMREEVARNVLPEMPESELQEMVEELPPPRVSPVALMLVRLTGVFFFALIAVALSLFAATVLFFGFRVLGHEGGYKSVLSVALHAGWPPLVVGTVLVTTAMWFYGQSAPEEVFASLFKTDIGSFLTDPSPVMLAIAEQFSVFSAWEVVLAGIGFATVLGISRRRSFAVVLAFWVVASAVTVLLELGADALAAGSGVASLVE